MWGGRSPLAPLSSVLPVKACLSGPRAYLKEQHQSREAGSLRATQVAEMRGAVRRKAFPPRCCRRTGL